MIPQRRTISRRLFILLVSVIAIQARPAAAQELRAASPTPVSAGNVSPARPSVSPDSRFTLSLQPDQLFQPVPAEVYDMTPAPDGRLWLTIIGSQSRRVQSREDTKTQLAREFNEPSPQLVNLRPLLIEPGGRIWAISDATPRTREERLLLGYDGKTFEEKPIAISSTTTNLAMPRTTAASADSHAFFAVNNTVYSFDGHAWKEETFPVASNEPPLRLIIESDGKGVIACGRRPTEVWRWRQDKWTRLPVIVPAQLPSGSADALLSAACSPAGAFLLTPSVLLFIPMDPNVAETQTLIAQLRDNNPQVRDKATKDLRARGPCILPTLHLALLAAEGNDAKYRIQWLIDQYDPPVRKTLETRSNAPATPLGDFIVRAPEFLLTLLDGSILVGANDLRDATDHPMETATAPAIAVRGPISRDLTGGILKIDPAGVITRLCGYAGFHALSAIRQTGVDATTLPDGHFIWCPALPSEKTAALFDPSSGAIQKTLNGPKGSPIAAKAGYIFFREKIGGQIVAWDPGATDTRHPVEIVSSQTGDYCVVTGDGKFWLLTNSANRAAAGSRPPIQYCPDGKSAILIPHVALSTSTPILGHAGLLTETDQGWQLVTASETFRDLTAQDLLAFHLDAFKNAWKGTTGTSSATRTVAIDKADRPWVIDTATGEPMVLLNQHWIGPTPVLTPSRGSRIDVPLQPMPDGTMWIAFVPSHEPALAAMPAGTTPNKLLQLARTSWFASIVDNTMQFAPAPQMMATQRPFSWTIISDSENSAWLPTAQTPGGIVAQHWSPAGLSNTIEGAVPLAMDRAGNLWAGRRASGQGLRLELYHDGNRVIPSGLDSVLTSRPIIVSQNGNLYVPIEDGLQQYIPTPKGPTQYAVGARFKVDAAGNEPYIYSKSLDIFAVKAPQSQILFFRIPTTPQATP